ncbi:MAG: polysaccharide deacetylase family protein [Chitinivibrionales bacterium]|nr:polysaccharide deacetylase family protein [Chitinivibrionales bacterium]
MVITSCVCGTILVVVYFIYRYSLFVPAKAGIPILMYHKISAKPVADTLSISGAMFERHLRHMAARRYSSVTFSQLHEHLQKGTPLPKKSVIITFDDGYEDNYSVAFPILKRYGFKAAVALVGGSIGQTNQWDCGTIPLLRQDQIQEMAASGIEFCLHSYRHQNYADLSCEEIEQDIQRCIETFQQQHIRLTKVFMYPFGKQPTPGPRREHIHALFQTHGILFALLIKSKINPLPIENPYELKRINLSGADSFFEFTIKLKKGRARLII